METDDGIKSCKLIAVHAGLENGKGVNEQLKLLKSRNTGVPKVVPFSGRGNVWDIPEVIACNFFGRNISFWSCINRMLSVSRCNFVRSHSVLVL